MSARALFSAVFAFVIAAAASGAEIAGKVVGVADGDTITVLDGNKNQHRIRLLHIDCPESNQAFGTKAKQALSDKVFGEQVVIRWSERDRYDRILGDVHVGKRWVNAEMVKDGFAWHYKQYSKDETIAKAETEARALKLNIWSQANPTPPWDFRRGGEKAAQIPPNKSSPPAGKNPPKEVVVYVTKTGEKYHTETCASLSKSKIAQALDVAKASGLTPCSKYGARLLK